MNILYTVDDNFVPQLATCICSICENNNSASSIDFYVFSNGISANNIQKLEELVTSYGQTLHIVDISGFMNWLGFDFDTTGWNEIVLARLIMARLLPDSIDRVLYLDGDTMVRRDLQDLWASELPNATLGMAMEPTVDPKRLETLGLLGKPYFNAGVLLVDLQAWRERDVEHRLLECCQNERERLFANDQDAINLTLANEIEPLSPAYNYCNSFYIYPYRTLKRLMPSFVSKEVFDRANANPCIVHFLGEERPWRLGNTHRYGAEWRRYLSKTPWRNTALEQGWKTYFVLWRIFNTVTKPVPMIRWRIINSLIPRFIALRSRRKKRDRA